MTLPIALGLVFLTSMQAGKPTDLQDGNSAEEKTEKQWLKTLAPLSSKEPMIVDIDLKRPIPLLPSKVNAMWLDILAHKTRRSYSYISGVHIVSQRIDPASMPSTQEELLSGLASLGADEIEKLASGSLTTNDLPAGFQSSVLALAWNFAPLQNSIDRGDALQVSSWFEIGCEYQDASGQVKRFSLPAAGPKTLERLPKMQPPPRLDVEDIGPLDFGAGSIMTFPQVLQRAGEAFKVVYRSDPRLESATYFVSGRYTKLLFEKILGEAIDPLPTRSLVASDPGSAAVEKLAKSKFSSMAQDMHDDQALRARAMRGGTLSGTELAGLSPYAADFLRQRGLAPDTQIKLKPVLILQFHGSQGANVGEGPTVQIIIRR